VGRERLARVADLAGTRANLGEVGVLVLVTRSSLHWEGEPRSRGVVSSNAWTGNASRNSWARTSGLDSSYSPTLPYFQRRRGWGLLFMSAAKLSWKYIGVCDPPYFANVTRTLSLCTSRNFSLVSTKCTFRNASKHPSLLTIAKLYQSPRRLKHSLPSINPPSTSLFRVPVPQYPTLGDVPRKSTQ
jgi:hypothetical protein